MSKVLVMTDTVACIPQNLAQKYNIKIVPAAHIHYNGRQYIDGVNLSAADAYRFIKNDPDRFITSAITPAYVLEELTKASKESDSILFISLSSSLSATSKTVSIAAGLLREELPRISVKVLDSKTVAGSQGLIVLAAARAAEETGSTVGRLAHLPQDATNQRRESRFRGLRRRQHLLVTEAGAVGRQHVSDRRDGQHPQVELARDDHLRRRRHADRVGAQQAQ